LALELGYANVDAMLREMTAQQFAEWIAYYQIEPFGTLSEDAEWAHWKSIYTNAHIRKGKPRIKTEKFLLYAEKPADASGLYEGGDYEDL
jgi:hypothetical protein